VVRATHSSGSSVVSPMREVYEWGTLGALFLGLIQSGSNPLRGLESQKPTGGGVVSGGRMAGGRGGMYGGRRCVYIHSGVGRGVVVAVLRPTALRDGADK
jgi:hypothetical protein